MSRKINRARTKQINVYFYEEEYELLESKAKESGVSKSEYLRNMVLLGSPNRTTNFSKEEAEQILFEIGKIGNNINQIAKYINFQKSIDGTDMQNLIREFGDLQSLLLEVCIT